MRDRDAMIWGALLGAALGAAAGYLFLTDRGRRLRRDVEPELRTLVEQAMRIGSTVADLRQQRSRATAGGTPLAWPRRT